MGYKVIILTSVILIGVIIRCYFGVFEHDEFGGKHLFLKHKPTWKWAFYSPIGMSDLQLEDLNYQEKQEQLLFNEFVTQQNMSK